MTYHSSVEPRLLIRRIRALRIDDTAAVGDGIVTRLSNRTIRYEVYGRTVKTFTGKWADVLDRMLCYLGLETQEQQQARREWIAERMEAEDAA